MTVSKPKPPVGYSLRQLMVLAGGRAVVAKECGISRLQWTTHVPDRHVLAVARLSGLPVSTIRPDFPAEVHG